MSKFVVFPNTANGQYYFRLEAGNGEPILASTEGYTSQANCFKGIESVRENSQIDARYQKERSKDDQYYFVLKAQNGEPIGKSEMYKTEIGRDGGIASVKVNAPTATIEELKVPQR